MDLVDLVVPVKALGLAKSRLRGAADNGVGDPGVHAQLALALAHDTVAAARGSALVGRLVLVTADPVVAAEFAAVGVEVIPEGRRPGLNAAYRHGAAHLTGGATLGGAHRGEHARPIGALQADLPALRPAELDAALAAAGAAFATGAVAAFCQDAAGSGTTLLVSAAGSPLQPRFGPGSATRHHAAGARTLVGDWPGLRRDVDTGDDLRAAAELGLGPHTRGVLQPCPEG